MKRLLPLIILTVLFQSSFAATRWIVFKGLVDAKYNNTKIYLKRIPSLWKDSAVVKNGRFEFRKEYIAPCVYEFRSEYENDVWQTLTVLTEQPGVISIYSGKEGIERAKIKGSFAQTVYEQFLAEQKILLAAKVTAARIAADTVKRDPNQALLIETVAYEKDDVSATLALRTALKYPNTFASAYILEGYGYEADITEVEKAFYRFSTPVQESFMGEHLKVWLNKLKSADRGQTVADFSLQDASGQTVHFSAVKEKVVLINFWASWCGPCREEFILLRRLYEKYKDKGFAIISISVDESPTAWQKALDKEHLPWLQLRDEHRGGTVAERRFDVTRYPTVFLLNSDRKILYRDLRGGVLDKVIEGLVE